MPRGFLIKRSMRQLHAPAKTRWSYRKPPYEDMTLLTLEKSSSNARGSRDQKEPRNVDTHPRQNLLLQSPKMPDQRIVTADSTDLTVSCLGCRSLGRSDISRSPVKPEGKELMNSSSEISTAASESVYLGACMTPEERLQVEFFATQPDKVSKGTPIPLSRQYTLSCTNTDSGREVKSTAPKPKAMGKVYFEKDESTSSEMYPKIKSSDAKKRSFAASKKPLGEFICQLCKNEYPDPFSLAQHRCSKIARVDYRCPECGKVFSCPANLASHRRWHKPRLLTYGEFRAEKKIRSSVDLDHRFSEGKENAKKMPTTYQHQDSLESSRCQVQRLNAAQGSSGYEKMCGKWHQSPGLINEHLKAPDRQHVSVECAPYLGHIQTDNFDTVRDMDDYISSSKTFQGSLRQYDSLQKNEDSSNNQVQSVQITFPSQFCGIQDPLWDIWNKHMVWHGEENGILTDPGNLGEIRYPAHRAADVSGQILAFRAFQFCGVGEEHPPVSQGKRQTPATDAD